MGPNLYTLGFKSQKIDWGWLHFWAFQEKLSFKTPKIIHGIGIVLFVSLTRF